MYLKRIEISGFKSFAKKIALDFKTPITAIVGPNGSGKSNVAEAFRFVLGEQSMKSMRGKRTEDLIWNGSHTAPRGSRASVLLAFDNTPKKGNRLFGVDFDEVTIERVIHRDASTEYLLNGAPVRLKDITDMLGAAHIGFSGHHIISQGEADRILAVSTKERKAMIEDALGLSVYGHRKEEALRKLEKTAAHEKEAEALRREIKPHLRFLESQVKKIEEADLMRAELVEHYTTYFGIEEAYLEATTKTLQEKKKRCEDTREALEKKIQKAEETVHAIKVRLEKGADSTNGESTALLQTRERIVRELGGIEGELRLLAKTLTTPETTVPKSALKEILDELEGILPSDDVGMIRKVMRTVHAKLQTLVGSTTTGAETKKHEAALRTRIQDLEKELKHIEKEQEAQHKEETTGRDHLRHEYQKLEEAQAALFTLKTEAGTTARDLEEILGQEALLSRDVEAYEREKKEADVLVGHVSYKKHTREGTTREEQDERRRAIERLKIRLEDAGSGGTEIRTEFKETTERDLFLERELHDLTASRQALETLLTELDEELRRRFVEGVSAINKNFQKLFSIMFGGGTASIAVVREAREEEEEHEPEDGVVINVSLPRKKVRGLHMLSGGERALTSIALLFAMSEVNPPPFLILDETDAALDEANSRRYGEMVEELSARTQLIFITHNRETMSHAGVLFGVTMGKDGVSQLLSVGFEEAVATAQ